MNILFLDNPQDLESYRYILSSIKYKNPYYVVEFFEAFSLGLKNLICFYWNNNRDHILLPGYIREIEGHKDLNDFSSTYGYSGPLYSEKVDKKRLELFWKEVQTWMKNNNIITSFIRFSLDADYSGFPGELIITLSNIKGKILSYDDQWKQFDRKVRKNVTKAKQEGLSIQIKWGYELSEELHEQFYYLFEHTMLRNNADRFYCYKKQDIWHYVSKNGSLCAFAFVYDGPKVISTEMLLISDIAIYSFLGGTLEECFNKRPNDFLKYEVICWARENKFQYYVLGGGFGKDDGIFNFKRTFFPNDVVNYITGRQIINKKIYSLLVNEYQNKMSCQESFKQSASNTYFPEYQKPN